jgi:hypothetical protein
MRGTLRLYRFADDADNCLNCDFNMISMIYMIVIIGVDKSLKGLIFITACKRSAACGYRSTIYGCL